MANVEVTIQDEEGKDEVITLTDKEKLFVEYYAICNNGTKAAKEAGYSESTAKEIACEALKKDHVKKYLNHFRQQAWKRNISSLDEALSIASDVVRYDIANIFNEDGTVKDIQNIPIEERRAIMAMDITEMKDNVTGEALGILKKIKTADRRWAIDLIVRTHGGFEKDNKQTRGGVIVNFPRPDLSKLSVDELVQYRELSEKANKK